MIFGIRPEDLRFEATGGVECRIEQIEPMGRETLYVADSPLGTLRVLESGAGTRRAPGDTSRVGFLAEHVLLFERGRETLIPGARAAVPEG